MAITGTDAYGAFLDTGVAVAPTPRANTEIEVHFVGEVDSASKNTITQTIASHIPHRHKDSPR